MRNEPAGGFDDSEIDAGNVADSLNGMALAEEIDDRAISVRVLLDKICQAWTLGVLWSWWLGQVSGNDIAQGGNVTVAQGSFLARVLCAIFCHPGHGSSVAHRQKN